LITHQKTFDLIGELSPMTIWRSVVRSAELDRRLARVSSAREEISKMLSGGKLSEAQQHQAKELDSKMGDKLEITIALKEVCRIIRSKAADALAKDIASNTELAPHLGKCAAGLLEDPATFSDMVHCIAKKLVEVSQLKLFCASYMFPRFRRLRFKAESASFEFLKLIVLFRTLCLFWWWLYALFLPTLL